MDNNGLKGEMNLNLTNDKSKNENEALIITDKLKNWGVITINQIFQNAKNDDEKLGILSNEYIKLQSDFSELKNDFLSYVNQNELIEVPVLTEYTRDLNIELDKKNINYKSKIGIHNINCVIYSVSSTDIENKKRFNEIVHKYHPYHPKIPKN